MEDCYERIKILIITETNKVNEEFYLKIEDKEALEQDQEEEEGYDI